MEKIKLWNKNFIIVIVINFLVFLNHLMVFQLSRFSCGSLVIQTVFPAPAQHCFLLLPFYFGLLSAKYLIAESESLFCLWDCAEWL